MILKHIKANIQILSPVVILILLRFFNLQVHGPYL